MPVAAAMVAAAALSALATGLALAYARRRGLLDAPGPRRSHIVPTPRGGGIGIVLAVLIIGLLPAAFAGLAWALPLALALLAVAAVGWIDDHRPLSARLRLLVHLVAAGLSAGVLLGWPADVAAWVLLAAVIVALAWSINLHNFIDGIDGLLGLDAAAVFALLAAFAFAAGDAGLARLAAVAAAASAAFLPFNLPRARIFLGDVGSGALGLLLGALSLAAWRRGVLDLGAILMLLSACAVDATATLVSRMLRGRRWWRPHREHLYQWLVRSGSSHPRVALAYLAWTLGVVPLLLAARAVVQASPLAAASPRFAESLYFVGWPAATLLIAAGLWWAGKRACLRRVRCRARTCVPPN
jgi:UDP-N-acetylmuramyl pentapeptide phosphotransferase/UDP-N-acetylglucosamine-1-phosphate transferase